MRKRESTSGTPRDIQWVLFAGLVGLVCLLAVCMIGVAVLMRVSRQAGLGSTPAPSATTLKVAYSPEKEALFTALVADFNRQNMRTPDGQPMRVEAIKLDPEAMISAALDGGVQAISPDSSIWLDQLDTAWRAKTGSEAGLTGETRRYATTPVVLAMWEDVAQAMGYPAPIGWTDLLARAKSDPSFKWSHPSTTTASGLLATLAEFYAGAGLTRGLTEEAATAQSTLDYVGAIEKTVRFYGEGEQAVVERARTEGRDFLDAFVISEQLVIDFNRNGGGPRLVAVYPKEGTLWQDHPLALLEQPGLNNVQRLTFAALRDQVLSPEFQKRILDAGYRPADLNIPIDFAGSPISAANGVDPKQPQTTLQIPSANVVEVVRDVWAYTKRKTNVVLVVDTSGSMQGEKLENAQEALRVFLSEIKGDQERVGLIEFASDIKSELPLTEMGEARDGLESTVDQLEARGDTALLDAVSLAYDRLQVLGDQERINAIVAITDGRENHSEITLARLAGQIRDGNQAGVPVVVFCIAYGDDADMNTLRSIAEASGGQARRGDPETIRQLYKILSTYF